MDRIDLLEGLVAVAIDALPLESLSGDRSIHRWSARSARSATEVEVLGESVDAAAVSCLRVRFMVTKPAGVTDRESLSAAAAAGSLGDLVESALAVLVGELLGWLKRAADTGDFGFGPDVLAPTKRDPFRMGPTFALHLTEKPGHRTVLPSPRERYEVVAALVGYLDAPKASSDPSEPVDYEPGQEPF